MDNKETILETYFPKFVVIDTSFILLKQYLEGLKLNEREICRKMVKINDLALEKLSSSVIDAITMSELIKSIDVQNINKPQKQVTRSFKDAIKDYEEENMKFYLKNEFLYNNSIIYIDSFKDFPGYSYDSKFIEVKTYYQENSITSVDINKQFFPLAKEKINTYLAHYEIIKYILVQNGLKYVTINNLEGTTENMSILGVLIYSEKDRVLIQDPTKFVNIDIANAIIGDGFFPEGSIILATGNYKNDIFYAESVSHPPIIQLKRTFKEKFDLDFFGALTKAFKLSKNSNNINENNMQLDKIESKDKMWENLFKRDLSNKKILFPKLNENKIIIQSDSESFYKNLNVTEDYLNEEFIIIISNPDLTSKAVLLALEKLFVGFKNSIPFMIIFIGNFLPETSFQSFINYSSIFENLTNLIFEKNREIAKNSYIVMMPGPNDFNLTSAFPKQPINQVIIDSMRKKLNWVFSISNPGRFSIFGKEFVFFRDSLNKKLSRYSLIKNDSIDKNNHNLVHTILSQKSLSPLNLALTPRIWDYSNSMLIYPLPDFLCLADLTKDYIIKNGNTIVFNPGNFSKDFSFSLVYPNKNEIQPSKINL